MVDASPIPLVASASEKSWLLFQCKFCIRSTAGGNIPGFVLEAVLRFEKGVVAVLTDRSKMSGNSLYARTASPFPTEEEQHTRLIYSEGAGL